MRAVPHLAYPVTLAAQDVTVERDQLSIAIIKVLQRNLEGEKSST